MFKERSKPEKFCIIGIIIVCLIGVTLYFNAYEHSAVTGWGKNHDSRVRTMYHTTLYYSPDHKSIIIDTNTNETNLNKVVSVLENMSYVYKQTFENYMVYIKEKEV